MEKEEAGTIRYCLAKSGTAEVKDYKAILTVSELKTYLERCIRTGKVGFDWETAASKEIRVHYKKAFEDIEEARTTGIIDDKEAESRSESLEKRI